MPLLFGDTRVDNVILSADGSRLFTSEQSGGVQEYDVASGALVKSWTLGSSALTGMDLSPDGTFLVVADEASVGTTHDRYGNQVPQYTVHRIDLTTGAVTNYNTNDYAQGFYDVAILSDGRALVSEAITATTAANFFTLDFKTKAYTALSVPSSVNTEFSESSDHSKVIAGEAGYSTSGTVDLLEFSNGQVTPGVHAVPYDNVFGIQAYDNAGGFAVEATRSTVTVFSGELQTAATINFDYYKSDVEGVAFDAAGKNLYVLDAGQHQVDVYSTANWTLADQIALGTDYSFASKSPFGDEMAVTPDDKYLLVNSSAGVERFSLYPKIVLDGGADHDVLTGGPGNDDLAGNGGADMLSGGDGDDVLYAGSRSPAFTLPYGSEHAFTLPRMDSGAKEDVLQGGNGDDTIFAGYGDAVDGGANSPTGDTLFLDLAAAPSGVTADFTQATVTIGGETITGIERVALLEGSAFDDVLRLDNGYRGTEQASAFGEDGNDSLFAGRYTLSLYGGDGNDILDGTAGQVIQWADGGAGDDIIRGPELNGLVAVGGDGNDVIYNAGSSRGGAGNDTIIVGDAINIPVVDGGDGNDVITVTGNAYWTSLTGGAGDDVLTGGSGDDTLLPDTGVDRVDGRDGNDTLLLTGNRADYSVVTRGAAFYVTDDQGDSVQVTGIESVRFADGLFTWDTLVQSSTPDPEEAKIYRLYETILGRAPDAGGLATYSYALHAGQSLDAIATDMFLSDEASAFYKGLSNKAFVTKVYETAFGREPDPDGLATYTNALNNKTISRVDVILAASESDEKKALTAEAVSTGLFTQDVTQVHNAVELLYDAIVNRAADPGGLSAYEREYATGSSLLTIASQMASSGEAMQLYGGLDNKGFVDELYKVALNREADPAGEAALIHELDTGTSRGTLLWEAAGSSEHQALLGLHSDLFM